jgi:two-component system sensor histidine kinase RegB
MACAPLSSRRPARLGFSEVWVGESLSTWFILAVRWLAVIGQGATVGMAFHFGVAIPWIPIAIVLSFSIVSNVALDWWRRLMGGHLEHGVFHVLLWDIFSLTTLLYWTGGLENPFTVFFLVQLTLATVTLRTTAAIGLGVAMVMACGFLWQSWRPLMLAGGDPLPGELMHLGQLIALPLAGGTILVLLLAIRARSGEFRDRAEALRRELESQDRFLSLAALATGFAHEMATPISSIVIAAEDLEQAGESGESAALISREALKCRDLLTKLRLVEQEAIDAGAVPESVARVVADAIGELPGRDRQRIEVRMDPGTASVCAIGLREALLVLIRNALQATGNGGAVGLSVFVSPESVTFSVTDSGPGFEPEMLRCWGEPFRSGREGGLGLGLFFARRFANARGGRLDVSNPGSGGARVDLTLPLAGQKETCR